MDDEKYVGLFAKFWVIIVLVVVLLGFACDQAYIHYHQATTGQRVNVEINDQVNNGAHVIQVNKDYFDKYNQVVSLGQQEKDSAEALSTFKTEHKNQTLDYGAEQEESQLQSTYQGQKSAVQQFIADYNTSSQTWSDNVFKDSALPRTIDPFNPPTQTLTYTQSAPNNTLNPVNPITNVPNH